MRAIILLFAALFICRATNVAGISFEELTTQSDRILTGKVLHSTTSWGSGHKYIWTRYEVSVSEVLKGTAGKTIIVSEPGGQLDGRQMRVAGTVIYAPGERVALFLKAYGADNRTVGWAQGKFSIDDHDRVHPCATAGSATAVGTSAAMAGSTSGTTPLARLDGIGLNELRDRVRTASASARAQGRAR